MKTTSEKINEVLSNLSDSELKDLWNDYQAEIRGESQIYDFDDSFFDEFFNSPGEAARAVYMGNIESWNASYVMFNGYGNLEASNSLSDMISFYDLANHIESNQDDFENLLAD